MKTRLHPTPAMQKAIDAYAESKIRGIRGRAQGSCHERAQPDIATRATYLCLLACYQVGLSPRTLKRIQDAMTGPVADKYNEYRNDQLADLWAQVTLQSIGIEAPKTRSRYDHKQNSARPAGKSCGMSSPQSAIAIPASASAISRARRRPTSAAGMPVF